MQNNEIVRLKLLPESLEIEAEFPAQAAAAAVLAVPIHLLAQGPVIVLVAVRAETAAYMKSERRMGLT